MLNIPAPCFDVGKGFSQKIEVVKGLTTINLHIFFKGMDAWEDRTHSLTFQLNFSISGTCYFLDAQFRDMPMSAISAHSSPNSLSACIRVILEPHYRYSLLTCLIPSSIFFIFLFLIMLPVEKIMYQGVVFRN